MVISDLAKSLCHVERNLKYLANMPRVGVSNIRDFRGGFHKKKRVGRGGVRGKTCGKGHKGQGQKGTKPRIGFEGGQTPFYRRVPKHGFTNAEFKLHFATVHLNRIQYFIDSQRIDPTQTIDIAVLKKSGCVQNKIKDGVKLLGGGASWFQADINIEVSRASENSITAIERNGGTVKCVYHDKIAMNVLLRPNAKKYAIMKPKAARPNHKLILWYSNPDNRGYLADPEEVEKRRQENAKLGKITDQLADLKIAGHQETAKLPPSKTKKKKKTAKLGKVTDQLADIKIAEK